MSKNYLVTAIEEYEVIYSVKADSEEEAQEKVENRDANDGVFSIHETYHDFGSIQHVEEDI